MRHRLLGIALVAYWIAEFLVTHLPMPKVSLPTNSDKVVHFTIYTGLATLLLFWLATKRPLRNRDYGIVFVVCAIYGVFDELSQFPVNRSPEVLDWLADCTGAVFAVLVIRLILRYCIRQRLSADRTTVTDSQENC